LNALTFGLHHISLSLFLPLFLFQFHGKLKKKIPKAERNNHKHVVVVKLNISFKVNEMKNFFI